jgi:poly(hydroxyalkanoate) granule-associated protein
LLISLNAGERNGRKNINPVKEKTMARKSKKLAKKSSDYELMARIRESANQIWLAGLGAFADAQKQGGNFFDALVRQGKAIEKRAAKATGQGIADVKTTASRSWDKLENVFEAGVAHALHTLSVPTKTEFDRLSRRVAELGSPMKRRRAAMTRSSHKRRKSVRS